MSFEKINTTVDCLYVNGCSWTYGVGLEESTRLQQCWAALIAKHLNIELIMGAMPGSSNPRILRTSVQDLDKLVKQGRKPFVLIAWSHLHRYELNRLDNNKWDTFAGSTNDGDLEIAKLITAKYNSDPGNVENFIVQLLLFQSYIRDRELPSMTTPTFQIHYDALKRDYLLEISERVDKDLFLYDFNLRSYLNTFGTARVGGPGSDHPGVEGHELLAEFLIRQLERRYNFNVSK
jgi:hypothetical protein